MVCEEKLLERKKQAGQRPHSKVQGESKIESTIVDYPLIKVNIFFKKLENGGV